MRSAKPFLKWVGGKGQLLSQFEAYFPAGFKRYVEPFVGGGAVFFHLWNAARLPQQVRLLDHNAELINAYRVVRDRPQPLIAALRRHRENHNPDYYYQIRALDRAPGRLSAVDQAARTIYLNKTCYNGLYRVNRKGQFNGPLGRYRNPGILSEQVLLAASNALQGVHLGVSDFRHLPDKAHKGDFYYFDPPYHPVSETANFTSYSAGNFREADQRDLAAVFAELTRRGARCMLSNSYTPFILDLYAGFRLETVFARRAVNSDSSGRGQIREVLVLNY